jgi:mycothiol S-conjugate amidase
MSRAAKGTLLYPARHSRTSLGEELLRPCTDLDVSVNRLDERPYEGLRLLAAHAHPDDESSKGAGTTALYSSLGAQVLIATFTGGEAGDILNPAVAQSPAAIRDIAGLRREEMANAAAILGAEQRWIGFVDSGLPEGDFETQTPHGCFYKVPTDVAARPLVGLIRQFRPQVVTTYDEQGGYPHPDHIKAHIVTMAAVEAAAQPDYHPELGAAWQVQKVYYNQDLSPKKWRLLDETVRARGLESPFTEILEHWAGRLERDSWLSTVITCGPFVDTAEQALLAHRTQIDPQGGFFSATRRAAKRVLPTEDFELVVDTTGRGPLEHRDYVESDLFAGVTDDAGHRVPEDRLDAIVDANGWREPEGLQ